MTACIGYQKSTTCCNIVYNCVVPSKVMLNVRGLLQLPVMFPQIAVSIYGKAAHTIICWNIGTSDIGVVGGSGAAATV